jgi:hypothetical protein
VGAVDSISSGQGPVSGCCECGDEPSVSSATLFRTVTVAGSSVDIVSGYGLDDQAIRVRSPSEARGFFL